jgi:hypothetical protein
MEKMLLLQTPPLLVFKRVRGRGEVWGEEGGDAKIVWGGEVMVSIEPGGRGGLAITGQLSDKYGWY